MGFPKCGTSSLHDYFIQNKIRSAHQSVKVRGEISEEEVSVPSTAFIHDGNTIIGLSMHKRKCENKLLLSDFPDITAFTQIDWTHFRFDWKREKLAAPWLNGLLTLALLKANPTKYAFVAYSGIDPGIDPGINLPYVNALGNVCSMSLADKMVFPQLTDIELLIEQYPNAKFILNTRNVIDWIKSINRWHDSSWQLSDREGFILNDLPYLPVGKGSLDKELIEWYEGHTTRVKNIFKDKKDKLFIINIDNPDISGFNNFCELFGVEKFPHKNKSGC